MTGAFVRVKRAGSWQNIKIDQLTDGELDTFLHSCSANKKAVWAKFLAGWIRDHVGETVAF